MIKPVITPMTMPSGTSVSRRSFTWFMRRSSSAAVKKMTASLATSDGWMPKPAMPNQRRVPLMGALNRTATSARAAKPSAAQMSAGWRHTR